MLGIFFGVYMTYLYIHILYIYIYVFARTYIHVFASRDGSICLSPTFPGPFECEENISTEKMYVGAMPPHWAVTNEQLGPPKRKWCCLHPIGDGV